ncbi:MAG: hypothetical protein IJ233_10775, partial [Pyramidobacter sp.]|nr:hypothetical protein [Pyramidobacter sp.]
MPQTPLATRGKRSAAYEADMREEPPRPGPRAAQPPEPIEKTETARPERHVPGNPFEMKKPVSAQTDATAPTAKKKTMGSGVQPSRLFRRARPKTEAEIEKKKTPFRIKFLRFVFGLGILAATAGVFMIWRRQAKQEALPPMFTPQPYYYEEEQPVHALLLWREKVVTSPVTGTVQLAAGQKASVVAANDVVATVLSRGKGTPVRVPARGYFLPALDGAEDSWEYSSLWLGSGLLPEAPQNRWVKDLAPLDQTRAVGRLIYLPQDPRAIFYLNLTDTLKAALERGTLTIRRQSRGPKWTAHVRVFVKYSEQRAK